MHCEGCKHNGRTGSKDVLTTLSNGRADSICPPDDTSRPGDGCDVTVTSLISNMSCKRQQALT